MENMTSAPRFVEGKNFATAPSRATDPPPKPLDERNHAEHIAKRSRMQDLDCPIVDMEIVDLQMEPSPGAEKPKEIRVGMESEISYAAILTGKGGEHDRKIVEST